MAYWILEPKGKKKIYPETYKTKKRAKLDIAYGMHGNIQTWVYKNRSPSATNKMIARMKKYATAIIVKAD